MPIRVVLADDHYLVREALRGLLDAEPGIEVAAVCHDLNSLLAAVEHQRPDVVVTDIRMPRVIRMRASRRPSSCGDRMPT